jgi:hypothetical protein
MNWGELGHEEPVSFEPTSFAAICSATTMACRQKHKTRNPRYHDGAHYAESDQAIAEDLTIDKEDIHCTWIHEIDILRLARIQRLLPQMPDRSCQCRFMCNKKSDLSSFIYTVGRKKDAEEQFTSSWSLKPSGHFKPSTLLSYSRILRYVLRSSHYNLGLNFCCLDGNSSKGATTRGIRMKIMMKTSMKAKTAMTAKGKGQTAGTRFSTAELNNLNKGYFLLASIFFSLRAKPA